MYKNKYYLKLIEKIIHQIDHLLNQNNFKSIIIIHPNINHR